MAYSDKLKDPRWQKKRLEVLNRDDFTCQICCDNRKTLHVHHRRYIKNKDPWDYPDQLLVTLCEDCHESETNFINEALQVLCDEVRAKFFSHDIITIARGFCFYEKPNGNELSAQSIEYFLEHAGQTMLEMYLETLPNPEKLPY